MNKKILCIGIIVIAALISLTAVSAGLFNWGDNGEVQDVSIKKPTHRANVIPANYDGKAPLESTPVTMEFVPYKNIDNYKKIKIVNGETKYKNGTVNKWKNTDLTLDVTWQKTGTDPSGMLVKNNLYILKYKHTYKIPQEIEDIDTISGDIIAETTTGDIFLTHLDEKF